MIDYIILIGVFVFGFFAIKSKFLSKDKCKNCKTRKMCKNVEKKQILK